MATKAKKTHVGTMHCMCCGREIPVKAAENGTLNAACSWCDFPAYARHGTESHRIITSKLKNRPETASTGPATAAPVAAAPAAAAPARRAKRSIFDLGA